MSPRCCCIGLGEALGSCSGQWGAANWQHWGACFLIWPCPRGAVVLLCFHLRKEGAFWGYILSRFLACFCLLCSRLHEALGARPTSHPGLMLPSVGAALLLSGAVQNGTEPGRQGHSWLKCPDSSHAILCVLYLPEQNENIRLMNTRWLRSVCNCVRSATWHSELLIV